MQCITMPTERDSIPHNRIPEYVAAWSTAKRAEHANMTIYAASKQTRRLEQVLQRGHGAMPSSVSSYPPPCAATLKVRKTTVRRGPVL